MRGAKRLKIWQRADVEWLQRRFGAALRSVIMHTDEGFFHHHWIVAPDSLALTMDMHPGHVAKRLVRAAGGDTTKSNKAYCAAMRAWQDSYHDEVAGPFGFARVSSAPRKHLTTAAVRAAVAAGDWIPGVGPVRADTRLVNKHE